MSRKLKRVPMEFNWPLNQIWGGYVNPFSGQSIQCPDCEGSGGSPEAIRLKNLWYGYVPFKPEDRGSRPFTVEDAPVRRFAERNAGNSPEYYGSGEAAIIREANRLLALWNNQWCHHLNADDVAALIEAGRLMEFTHTWTQGDGWQPKDPPCVPTPEEVNAWSLGGFGHDSINQWVVCGAERKRLGVSDTCSRCGGSGKLWPTPEIEKLSDDWKETEPPAGKGFQLWEDTSEGSPVSPVFASLDALCQWAETNATTFGHERTTAARWKEMLEEGFVRHEEGNSVYI